MKTINKTPDTTDTPTTDGGDANKGTILWLSPEKPTPFDTDALIEASGGNITAIEYVGLKESIALFHTIPENTDNEELRSEFIRKFDDLVLEHRPNGIAGHFDLMTMHLLTAGSDHAVMHGKHCSCEIFNSALLCLRPHPDKKEEQEILMMGFFAVNVTKHHSQKMDPNELLEKLGLGGLLSHLGGNVAIYSLSDEGGLRKVGDNRTSKEKKGPARKKAKNPPAEPGSEFRNL